MLSRIAVLTCYALPFLAQAQKAPHHLLQPGTYLSEASTRPARQVAIDFLQARRSELSLTPSALDGVYLYKEYKTAHNGVTHLIYRQRFQGVDVENAEWVVNVDRDGRVLNAGGQLYEPVKETLPDAATALTAVRAAVMATDGKAAQRFQPFQKSASLDGRTVRFHGGPMGEDVAGAMVWHAVQGKLTPAWRFHITASDGVSTEEVVVTPDGQQVLAQRSRTFHQNAAKPQGLVYEWNPIRNPRPGYPREGELQWVPRKLVSFAGDPVASPKGWVATNETAGNNTITGVNPLAIGCALGFDNCPFRPRTAVAPNLDFSFPLEVGPGSPSPTAFADASITSLFYFTNRVHDLFYAIGFDEAAGNFQAVNYTGQGEGGDPVYAYAQYGSAAPASPALNNASFSINEADGLAPRMNMYINQGIAGQLPGFFTDGSLDSDIVFHEYTHGVSARLARQMYTTFQGGAMGEALSDFFALEFNVPEGAPADGIYATGEYLLFQPGIGIRTRPYSTDTNINPLTFANLGRVRSAPEVHADGEIFVEALVEMRANLIQQFGEKEGRRRARLLVVDGMKLAVPKASMLDMRDAILLADTVDFKGECGNAIWRGFAKRGMGTLAQTGSGDSTHISASFDVPSNKGAIGFYEAKYVIGEDLRIIVHDANNPRQSAPVVVSTSSGARVNFTLQRRGSVFLGTMPTTSGPYPQGFGVLGIVPGDTITASYTDDNTGAGRGVSQVTADASPSYGQALTNAAPLTFPNETALGLRSVANGSLIYELPFEFPFFETKQKYVRVFAGGLLLFGNTPATSFCFNPDTLKQVLAIAPLFYDMRTNGALQTGENVYVSTTADAVTFRWVGESNPFAFQAADPMNFAAILYKDGRIEFRYGSGNRNLATGGLGFRGCPSLAATVGISNGHETFVDLSIVHNGNGTLENASSFVWEPPYQNLGGADGVLESPADGQVVEGVIPVQGVAYESEGSLTQPRVDIFIDGRAIAAVNPTGNRADFCRANNLPRCPNIGFRRMIDPAAFRIAPGPHTLEVRATNARGTTTGIPGRPVPFILSDKPGRVPEGAIESPREGATVSGTITVSGYAYAKDLLVSGVDVLIDGVTYGRAQYGVIRNDICGANSPGANCAGVGFQMQLDTRNGNVYLANGVHSMQIRVFDEAGRYTLVGAPVKFTSENADRELSKGVLVYPRQNDVLSGVVRVTGHAWDPAGRITSASLIVDGSVYSLTYGRPRPEECATLNVPACPNIGFETDFDTRRLSNGPHVLWIRVINDRGTQTTFPLTTIQGINVFVQNQ